MIKFQKHYVTDGETKARVYYHFGWIRDGVECVTLYAKDYGRSLDAIFDGVAECQNDTDFQTDYFEKSRVRIFASDPLYAAARARCEE